MCSRCRDLVVVIAALVLTGCGQDERSTVGPPAGARVTRNRQSELQPGPATPNRPMKTPLPSDERVLADGKRLYNQFNCSGCHAAGGGAIGPPLMDDKWIYGSQPENVFWTIIEGRPQGMPAFGGRIAEDQAWRIVAYVRSLSGLHKQQENP